MARRNNRPSSADLYTFRDLDLMLKLEAEADPEGWVTTEHLARTLGFRDYQQPIAIRLAWMRRYGMVERQERERVWRLTSGAERVIEARLRAAQARTIETLPDESMIEVMANITARYRLGDPMLATMLRREFLYGTKRRP